MITRLRTGGEKIVTNWDLGVAQEFVMAFDSFHVALAQFTMSIPIGKSGSFKFDTTTSLECGIWVSAATTIAVTDVTVAINPIIGGLSSLALAGAYIRIQWVPTAGLEPVGAKANGWLQAKSL